jgi:hypothetical protein
MFLEVTSAVVSLLKVKFLKRRAHCTIEHYDALFEQCSQGVLGVVIDCGIHEYLRF